MRRLVLTTAAVIAMTITSSASYVTAESGLRVRATPSTEAEILKVLPFGTEVTGTIRSGWMKTDDGYLKAEFLSEDNPLDEMQCLGEWRVTAYYATGSPTASGAWPETNVTLAHNTLPFGTVLYIEGLGTWTVQDRGPTYLGSEWCDLYLGDYGTCVQFGERTAKVYVKEMP